MVAKCIVHVHISAEVKAYRLTYLVIYVVMWTLYVDYGSSAVGHTYAMWHAYLLRSICQ